MDASRLKNWSLLSGLFCVDLVFDGMDAAGMDDENDQVPEGRSVDALALRGDEGRGTLR